MAMYLTLAAVIERSIRNLWPDSLRLNVDGRDLGTATKDALEDRVQWLVRSEQPDLKQAQK